jgi:YHS domain-containing protein
MYKMCLMTMISLIVWAAMVLAQAPQAVDALEGLDPVLLARGKEAQGELKITVTRGPFRYMFANEANKAAFEKDPARYEIQLGGACARMGAPTRGIADLYAVHNSRIYIFGSEQCKRLFVAAPEKYLPPEKAASAATPEALKKGQALLEKAVTSMGGAAKLDGLISYHEKSVTTQTRGPRGEVEVKNDLLLAFPERARLEVVMPDFNDAAPQMRITTVLADAPFVISRSGKVLPLDAPQRADQEQQLHRKPLALLRARASLKAAYSGAGKVGETAVEHVAIELAGIPATLGIDPVTGRLLSLSYKRRGPQGTFGEFTQIFSDFRTVEGVTLPFRITATFDGQPWKDQSSVIEAITINGAVDPKLFEKPQEKQ